MNFYPVNIVFAVAAASSMVFIGFLPAQTLQSKVIAREMIKAAIVWALIAAGSPKAIIQYPIGETLLCLVAWREFRRDDPLMGKVWLSIASGLGISMNVMLILSVTPLAYPVAASSFVQTLTIASVYLGGSVIGLAYVSGVLLLAGPALVKRSLVDRYVGLLLALAVAHAVVVVLRIVDFGHLSLVLPQQSYDLQPVSSLEIASTLILELILLPALATTTWLALRAGLLQRTRLLLLVICLFAMLAELYLRHLGL